MSGAIFRFDDIELDLGRYELRRDGRLVRLERLPMELLILLASRQGELITREEVIEHLWGKGVYLDVDQGINTAIRKIRMCLQDSTESPKYIQTVVGKGYRFIPRVTTSEPFNPPSGGSQTATPSAVASAGRFGARSVRQPSRLPKSTWIVVTAIAVLSTIAIAWRLQKARAPQPPIRALAVLPFANLSGNLEQDYFVDGVTDELITQLAKIGDVRVISRTSSMHYKHSKESLPQIARELDVDAVIEGAVARSGNRVRVTVQFIRASSDQHLWANDYERDVTDLLDVQSEIAGAVTRELHVELAKQLPMPSAKSPINRDAYTEYLRGRFDWNLRREPALLEAIQHFENAIELDPEFAAPYSAIADSYTALGYLNARSPEETFARARIAAEKAIALDDSLAEPHASLGYYYLYFERNWDAAEKEFRTAIKLNPNYALAHDWYGVYLTARGRWDEALLQVDTARSLDPLSLSISTDVGFALYYSGKYDEAIASLQQTLASDPSFPLAHLWLGRAYEEKGMFREAISEFQKTHEALPEWPVATAAIGWVYGISGKRAEARAVLADLNSLSKRKYVTPYAVALVEASLNNRDEAFRRLNEGAKERTNWMVWTAIDPRWAPIRNDPRFPKLLREIGLENNSR
jgi:TolB-like protein/DNA-binding winged helix-turn-helix (wHTH) protein/lipoprotein NlpI